MKHLYRYIVMGGLICTASGLSAKDQDPIDFIFLNATAYPINLKFHGKEVLEACAKKDCKMPTPIPANTGTKWRVPNSKLGGGGKGSVYENYVPTEVTVTIPAENRVLMKDGKATGATTIRKEISVASNIVNTHDNTVFVITCDPIVTKHGLGADAPYSVTGLFIDSWIQ